MPDKVLTVWNRIKRGTKGQALGLTITTPVPLLYLMANRFNLAPYYLMASDSPISFERFINLLLTVKERLIKGWLVRFNGDIITHELTLSNGGVSIDGRLKEFNGIERGINYIRGKLPQALTAQKYYLGRNAQASILGLPQAHKLGEEVFLVSPNIQQTEEFGEITFFLDGATSLDNMAGLMNPLVNSKHLVRLTIAQPALSVVVEQLVIYKDQRNGVFSYDCYFRPRTEAINRNLRQSLLINEE